MIIEFTHEGKVVHKWNSFDHLPVTRIGYGTFGNYWVRRGFQYHRLDSCQCCSSHKTRIIFCKLSLLSAVIKVNKKHGEIEWILENSLTDLKDKLIDLPETGLNCTNTHQDIINWHIIIF